MKSNERNRNDGAASSGGRVLVMPGRLEAFEGGPEGFVERAYDERLTNVTLQVVFTLHPDVDGTVEFSFRRVATASAGGPGIEAWLSNVYCLHYLPGAGGRYAISPSLPGQRLRPPQGCPENHRERVVAAFLRANHDLFRRVSRPGRRFRVGTVVTFEGRTLATPSYWRLRWLGRGYQSSALFPEDPRSLDEAIRLLRARME